MYLRVTHGQWADPAAAVSEATAQVLEDLNKTITGLLGNQSYTGGVDPDGSGRVVAISVWDTLEHARFDGSVLSDIGSRLQSLGLHIDPSEVFEVTVPN
jgi:hypothetical protein